MKNGAKLISIHYNPLRKNLHRLLLFQYYPGYTVASRTGVTATQQHHHWQTCPVQHVGKIFQGSRW